jgi:hypothetical protein
MRKVMAVLATTTVLLGGAAVPAMASNGTPHRPDGQVVPVAPSDNGGDNGWGNCGHNSSTGNPHSDPAGGGNGGYKKGDACGAATNPTDPGGPTTDPTTPSDPGTGTTGDNGGDVPPPADGGVVY